jgi:hypothetical protein
MGAEFKEDGQPSEEVKEEETPKLFGDPDSYKHLSEEKRKEMTERMKNRFFGMAALRRWSS